MRKGQITILEVLFIIVLILIIVTPLLTIIQRKVAIREVVTLRTCIEVVNYLKRTEILSNVIDGRDDAKYVLEKILEIYFPNHKYYLAIKQVSEKGVAEKPLYSTGIPVTKPLVHVEVPLMKDNRMYLVVLMVE